MDGNSWRQGRPVAHMFCALLLSFAVASQAAVAAVYPLKKSANGRYLVDQMNVPYLITGDSPQALFVNLSEADAEMFLADREARGFNTVWINLLCTTYTGGRPDGSLLDGTLPFTGTIPSTSSYDLSAPNEAYFAHVDRILNLAAQHGLQVLLDPIETGGWLNTMLDNGTNKCRVYGQSLGNRYKNFANIIWMSGNDFQGWRDANNDAVALAVALGIKDTDTNHIQTVQLDYFVSSSLEDTNWTPIITLNATYTYLPTYAQLLADYNRSDFLPNFMVEANYEFEHNAGEEGTPAILRRQGYWTLLSGATGQLYGNVFTWQFISGWQTNLDTPGTIQFGYVKALFESRRWYDLIPDQNHTVVTAGYGTFNSAGTLVDNDYATAARTDDGTLVIVYLPTIRTITVDLSKLNGPVTAQWYDPSSGTYAAIPGSPFANSGSQDFTPTGTNADGDGDWVLVLESAMVNTWEVSIKGVPRATCVLKFAADSTIRGYGVEESLCGAFTVTGSWSQDAQGLLSSTFNQSFSESNCQHAASIDGTFTAEPGQKGKINATAQNSLGLFRWKAVRDPSFPALAADWRGTLRIKKSHTDEAYELTPASNEPGLYEIQGQSAGATYTFTGTLIITSRNRVTAFITRQLPTGPVASFYTGKVNPLKQTLSLTGVDATGAKHRLSAVSP